jgi:hypothetical protein
MRRHEALIRAADAKIPRRRLGLLVIAVFLAVPILILCWGWVDGPTDAEAVQGTITALRVEAKGEAPYRLYITVTLNDGSPVQCSNLRGGVGDRVSLTAQRSRLLGRRVIRC